MTVRDIFYLPAPAELERGRKTRCEALSMVGPRPVGRTTGRPGGEGAMIVLQDVHDADRPTERERPITHSKSLIEIRRGGKKGRARELLCPADN